MGLLPAHRPPIIGRVRSSYVLSSIALSSLPPDSNPVIMMVDLALLQSVSYIAGAFGVCVAAAYYVMNLRISQKNQELSLKALEQAAKTQELQLKAQEQNLETRQTQLFMQVIDKMDEVWFGDFSEVLYKWKWRDFKDFEKKYDPFKNEKFRNVFLTLEHLGILVNDGFLSPRLLYFWIGDFGILLWDKYEAVIIELRVKYSANFLEFFETLVVALKKEGLNDKEEFRKRSLERKVSWEAFRKTVPQ